jgi:hypothetical protein
MTPCTFRPGQPRPESSMPGQLTKGGSASNTAAKPAKERSRHRAGTLPDRASWEVAVSPEERVIAAAECQLPADELHAIERWSACARGCGGGIAGAPRCPRGGARWCAAVLEDRRHRADVASRFPARRRRGRHCLQRAWLVPAKRRPFRLSAREGRRRLPRGPGAGLSLRRSSGPAEICLATGRLDC